MWKDGNEHDNNAMTMIVSARLVEADASVKTFSLDESR